MRDRQARKPEFGDSPGSDPGEIRKRPAEAGRVAAVYSSIAITETGPRF